MPGAHKIGAAISSPRIVIGKNNRHEALAEVWQRGRVPGPVAAPAK